MTCSIVFACGLAAVLATPVLAHAQAPRRAPAPGPPVARGFLSINGGYQATGNDFDDTSTFRQNAEDGRLEADYTVKGGPAFDIAGGATVWRQLAVGVGVTRFSRSTPLALTASIPHPFFFSQPRSVSGEVSGLSRDELAIHLQLRGMVPTRGAVHVMVFGGPSFFQVKQDVVTDISYTEQYPYDVAAFGETTRVRTSASKIGYNAGADIAYFFSRQLGVGGTVQFTGATVAMETANGRTTDVKAGGLQAGGGLRVRF